VTGRLLDYLTMLFQLDNWENVALIVFVLFV